MFAETLITKMPLVFQQILKMGMVVQGRRDAIFVSLFQKGPGDLCNNYRGITLISFFMFLLGYSSTVCSSIFPPSFSRSHNVVSDKTEGKRIRSLLHDSRSKRVTSNIMTNTSVLLAYQRYLILWTGKHSEKNLLELVCTRSFLVWLGSVLVESC